MDYQKTLNLPQTDFSMKANLVQREPALLEAWAKDSLYEKIKSFSKGRKQFILHDGPPYANGNIHIGHALNKILKDMIVKFKFMEGFDSFYLPGWDCHGLPIEHQLLKELKKRKMDVDCLSFRKSAHDYAMKYVGIQRDEFKRLGVFGEWDHPYLTLNPEYEYWILRSLSDLNKKGYVYRGLKPVNWCFSCETALAEAEVEHENHQSPSVYVKFKVKNPEVLKNSPDKNLYLLIWTTTPWTLLANVAVAVHAQFKYSLVEVGNDVLIIESSLVEKVMTKAGVKDLKVLKEVSGNDLTQLTYDHPFAVLDHGRVVVADYVTKEDGTGLVHTAPGHGQDDFKTGQKYGLDVLMPVDGRGIYTKDAKEFAGEHVLKANEKIILALKEKGTLLAQENISHSYPHCWRCKNPIIFRATKQWFLKIDHDHLRDKLKHAINNDVNWIPPAGKERILGMVASRPDWCLSRQRFWGVPIPAVACQSCDEHILFPEVIEKFAGIVKSKGSDAWFELDVKEFIPDNVKCPHCKTANFTKTFDILDVWFDSGVSHQAVVKGILGKELPAEMYLEGSDQHRGWFQSSLIPAVAMEGKAPFKNVLTHGFVVDGDGRKMSKSVGNVVSPQDIMKTHGADILRLWVASSSYHDDVRISKEIMERLVDSYRKIRNTVRYILGNLYDFSPDTDILSFDELVELDQWALYRLHSYVAGIREAYVEFDFAKVYKLVVDLCNEDLSSFYLDIIKDRLYTSHAKSPERRSAQTVLYHILNHLVRMTAPILSFTSEEIFAMMPKEKKDLVSSSIHLSSWIDLPSDWQKGESVSRKFEPFLSLREHVLKAIEEKRREGTIGGSREAKVIFETSRDKDFDLLIENRDLITSLYIVSQVEVVKTVDITSGVCEEFPKTQVKVVHADGQKCGRCWKFTTDVGVDVDHSTLCLSCATIVKEFK